MTGCCSALLIYNIDSYSVVIKCLQHYFFAPTLVSLKCAACFCYCSYVSRNQGFLCNSLKQMVIQVFFLGSARFFTLHIRAKIWNKQTSFFWKPKFETNKQTISGPCFLGIRISFTEDFVEVACLFTGQIFCFFGYFSLKRNFWWEMHLHKMLTTGLQISWQEAMHQNTFKIRKKWNSQPKICKQKKNFWKCGGKGRKHCSRWE